MTRMADQEPVEPTASAELVSFVPRLTLDWLRDQPDATWREVDGTLAFVDISGFTAMWSASPASVEQEPKRSPRS